MAPAITAAASGCQAALAASARSPSRLRSPSAEEAETKAAGCQTHHHSIEADFTLRLFGSSYACADFITEQQTAAGDLHLTKLRAVPLFKPQLKRVLNELEGAAWRKSTWRMIPRSPLRPE